MKALINLFLLFAIFIFSSSTLLAQDEKVQTYHVMDYMKVAPGNHADYLKVESAWKKIHQANIKAGKYIHWELTSVITANGSQAEYNYVTRISFKGEKAYAAHMENFKMPDNLKSLLTPEEMKYVDNTSKFRTFVKSETWAGIEYVSDEALSDKDSKIHVFNYFDHPEGASRSDHFKVERDIWMPMHKERIKNDDAEAWVLAALVFPFGSSLPYHDATVDVYKDMEQYMKSSFSLELVKKVHPGKDADKLFAATEAASDLVKGEVRMVIDKVEAPEDLSVRNK